MSRRAPASRLRQVPRQVVSRRVGLAAVAWRGHVADAVLPGRAGTRARSGMRTLVACNNGNLPLACAQLGDLAVSCDPVLDSVDGIDGRGHRTVNAQVDRQ